MLYPFAYLHLACLVLQVVAATLVAVSADQPAKRSFLYTISFGALWSLADFLSSLASTPEQLRTLHVMFSPVWAMVPWLVLRSARIYVSPAATRRSPAVSLALLLPAALCVLLAVTGRLHLAFIPASVNGLYFQILASPWQQVVSLYFLAYLLAAGLVLRRAGQRTGQSEQRRAARAVLWVVVPASVVGGLINGGLGPAGLLTPFLGSVIVALVSIYVALKILRSDFVPLTRYKQERDLAQESLSRREAVLDGVPDGLAIVEQESGHLLYANPRFAGLVGDAQDRLPPALASRLAVKPFPEGGQEIRLGAAKEKERVLLLRTAPLTYSGQAAVLIAVRDLTAQKALEAQLQEAQRMEAIGTLAGGVAHDMNNILGIVMGYASVLQKEMPGENLDWQEDLDQILAACGRGRDLTKNLLGFARRGKYRQEVFSLNRRAQEIQALLSRTIPKRITLETKLDPALPDILGDPSQLDQALLNICLNAVDATAGSGTMTISTEVVELHRADLVGHPDLKEGPYVCLSVRDSGCGMDAKTLSRCMEPLFTTKPAGQGTGLGLSMVYGTVTSHGGLVTVNSEPGAGATVRILLPVAKDVKQSTSSREIETGPLSDGQEARRILVVDDEPAVRAVVKRLLVNLGHQVILAGGGEEALRLLARPGPAIDLVILDLIMPDMNGEETYRQLRLQRPELPVLFASGYSQGEATRALLADGAAGFLQKPFDGATLARHLRAALSPTGDDAGAGAQSR